MNSIWTSSFGPKRSILVAGVILGLGVIPWTVWPARGNAETNSAAAERRPVPVPPPPEADGSGIEATWYALSPAQFARRPEALAAIQFSKPDRKLLAAAILHATNAQRKKHRLPALEYDPAATEAAGLQAAVMAAEQFVGHENESDPALKTPLDRIRKVGVRPGFIAENVALEFARNYRADEPFYTRTENGETVFSASPDGPPLPMHTYASFAAALVGGWMDSPGHRANILSDKPQRLGCAGAPARDKSGLEVLYCAQVFFTPAKEVKPSL